MIPFPDKRYNIIYADPPWKYQDKLDPTRRIKYNVESSAWIANLPVASIAADDCVLFLWVTFPQLDIVMDIIDKWGFSYKTVAFVWVKTIVKGRSLAWGMGRWTRSNAEICLLAVKGKPKRYKKDVHQIVIAPVLEHSRKPEEVREKIVRLCGNVPRIELFARSAAPGWDAWGNEELRPVMPGLLEG